MSNVRDVKPRVKTITLNDGVEREIRFTLNAMAELEDRYGSVDKAFDAMQNGSIKATRCVMWAGLLHGDANLTEKQVGDLIDLNSFDSIIAGLNDAMGEDMPVDNANGADTLPNA